jgi:uncharacterized membrane protein YfcA
MGIQITILAAVVIFSVASILSMFGKGGGEFYVPLLLTLSIPFQKAASASLLCLVFSGATMTVVYHRRMKQVDWQLAAVLFSTAGGAAFLGGFFSAGIDPKYLKLIFSVTLIIAAVVMYLRKSGTAEKIEEDMEKYVEEEEKKGVPWIWKRKSPEGDFDMNLLYVLPSVAIVGFLAGMVGISGGGLIVPIIIILGSVPLRTAFATNSVLVLLTSLMGLFGRGLTMGIDMGLALPVATAALIGALIGSNMSKKVNTASLQKYFIIVILIAAVWMFYRVFV